jgi:hypothetical protein
MIERPSIGDAQHIHNSISWYVRGKQSRDFDEKILKYWISMESLLTYTNYVSFSSTVRRNDGNKDELIVNYIPYVAVDYYMNHNAINLYTLLYNARTSGHVIDNIRYANLELPQDAVDMSRLAEPPQKMELKDCVDWLNVIRDSTRKEFLRDLIKEVTDVYSDSRQAAGALDNIRKTAKDNLYAIYRYRNQIAHNGETSSPVHEYVSRIAEIYSRQSLRLIINHKLAKPYANIEDSMAKLKMKIDIAELHSAQQGILDVTAVQKWGGPED